MVRVTSDCPLIDPSETDAVIAALEHERCDYASNILERTLPRGLDTEALWRDVLERVHRLAVSPPAREHVTWFVHSERPDLFLLHSVRRPYDAADLRWTVDTPQDLALVRRLYDELGIAERPVALQEMLDARPRAPRAGGDERGGRPEGPDGVSGRDTGRRLDGDRVGPRDALPGARAGARRAPHVRDVRRRRRRS